MFEHGGGKYYVFSEAEARTILEGLILRRKAEQEVEELKGLANVLGSELANQRLLRIEDATQLKARTDERDACLAQVKIASKAIKGTFWGRIGTFIKTSLPSAAAGAAIAIFLKH